MIEVAGGILLALLILFLAVVFFRSVAVALAITVLLAFAALLSMSEFGRTLVSVVIAFGVFGCGLYAADHLLKQRDAKRQKSSKWWPPLR